VKLNDRAPKPLNDLGGLEEFLEEKSGHPGGTLRLLPLVESLDLKRLGELAHRARRTDPESQLPDFSSWYRVVCPPGIDPDELAQGLRQLEVVETAYVMRPGPPPVNPTDDPRTTNQGYLDAAPNGIDARYAWGFPGGDGTGIGVVDMEQGWNLNHEDLAAAAITLLSGINNTYLGHGTSVLGEVLMVDNTVGGVGIAPSAKGRVPTPSSARRRICPTATSCCWKPRSTTPWVARTTGRSRSQTRHTRPSA
jgi:hypothetical protein